MTCEWPHVATRPHFEHHCFRCCCWKLESRTQFSLLHFFLWLSFFHFFNIPPPSSFLSGRCLSRIKATTSNVFSDIFRLLLEILNTKKSPSPRVATRSKVKEQRKPLKSWSLTFFELAILQMLFLGGSKMTKWQYFLPRQAHQPARPLRHHKKSSSSQTNKCV